MPAKDLAHAPPQTVADDRSSRALPDGDAEASPPGAAARQEEDLEMASGHADPGGIALFELASLSKAVVPGEGLPGGLTWAHTESLLRPLRRRADNTARPERVRILTRKPWVRLRRRLLGWYVLFIKERAS